MTVKRRLKKKRYTRTRRGGKAIGSGGFGCVFRPSLSCKSRPSSKKYVSKLMRKHLVRDEYQEIQRLQKLLKNIPQFQQYFLIDDIHVCSPLPLTEEDMKYMENKCSTDGINPATINDRLSEYQTLVIPFGGMTISTMVREWSDKTMELSALGAWQRNMIRLLQHGVVAMNAANVYHGDLKDTNILVDNRHIPRIIDWGLSAHFVPHQQQQIPSSWKNRPLQYNVPVGSILFTDRLVQMYGQWMMKQKPETIITLETILPFAKHYLFSWNKYRGKGHLRAISFLMHLIFGDTEQMRNVAPNERNNYVYKHITLPMIVRSLAQILLHCTNVEKRTFAIDRYMNHAFQQNLDMYGFVSSYMSLLEAMIQKRSTHPEFETPIQLLRSTMNRVMCNNAHEAISLPQLVSDMEQLATAFGEGKRVKVQEEIVPAATSKSTAEPAAPAPLFPVSEQRKMFPT